MRNEVAALVLLYFGVASEFISPLGGVKLGLANDTSKYNNTLVYTTAVSPSTAHTVELPQDNSIIQKDLYEYGVPNKNQSERAFIYIEKKFMKPHLLQRLKHHENQLKSDPEQSIHHVPPNIETGYICECKPKDHNSYFIDPEPFKVVDMNSYLAQLKTSKDLSEPSEQNMIHDNSRMPSGIDIESHNNIDITRSLIFSSRTDNYDTIPNQNFPPDQYIDFDKLRHIRKSLDLSKVKQETKSKTRATYGYNSPYARHRNSEFNEQMDNFGDSMNLQDLLAGDFDPEKSDYDDKLLDKYLKEDFDEESKINETIRYANDQNKSTLQQKDEDQSGTSAKCNCV